MVTSSTVEEIPEHFVIILILIYNLTKRLILRNLFFSQTIAWAALTKFVKQFQTTKAYILFKQVKSNYFEMTNKPAHKNTAGTVKRKRA